MILKRITAVVLIFCISCFAFMGTGCSKKSKGKGEPQDPVLVSKDMMIRSLTYAMMHEKPDFFWKCLAPNSQRIVLETAKQKSMTEADAKMECYTVYKDNFQQYIKKYKNDPAAIAFFLANDPTFSCEEVDGLWYVSLEEKKEESESSSVVFSGVVPVNHSSKVPLVNHLLEGVIAQDIDRVWICRDPRKQKLEKNDNIDHDLIKKEYFESVQKIVEQELEKHDFDADKTVEALIEKLSFVSVGNRWFLQ